MSGGIHPRVLIRTRPLSIGNYGGILQAYALQRALDELGVESWTDVTRGPGDERRGGSKGAQIRRCIKRASVAIGLPRRTRERWTDEYVRTSRNREISNFISRHIRTVALYSGDGVDPTVASSFDGFIVGSDQVWRAGYGRVPSYLFDFVGPDDQRPRIAYAASFGVDDLSEYNSQLLQETAPLARRFHALSVREESGVRLCKDAWNVTATQVLDPTLLLSRDHYVQLAGASSQAPPPSGLTTYVLDHTAPVRRSVDEVGAALGLTASPLHAPGPLSVRAYRRDPRLYDRPSVGQWLATMASSRYIVTDSFHGTVFAIIFNVPFIAIVNHDRGATRFYSLLQDLGLADRLIEAGNPIDSESIGADLDWNKANAILASRRDQSVEYLRKALAVLWQ